ncbi:TetR/AcrR family transcriptional regulator [Nonomuraea endophytica]|uniref:AcrR family transcriptional regulator n=1 Tax=Nonomuraea endophytica TaxID=714136 RepID=A0A7W8AGL9_9ACTN|nr:TetR-like C-terminal domain-containing protein [Nonomuraea endophytica]MBB5084756.1 AcrR family transcriptional regulator [Nonomuraea endophytica]
MARAGLSADRLTRAGAELADEIGFENVTVSALARRFGVKDASLYSHIKNAQDLRVRMAALALAEMADRAAAALAGRSGRDALAAFANAYRDYATQHPGRYTSAQIEIDSDGPAADAARRHSAMTRAILRGYALPEPDETDAVRLLHSTFHGFVSLERAGSFSHGARDSGASWARILDTLHTLLTTWHSD